MRKVKKHSVFFNTWFSVAWYFKIAPGYAILSFAQTIIGDIITLFEHTFLLAYIIDCVEKGKTLEDILLFLIPVATATTLKLTVNPFIRSYIQPKAEAKINKEIRLTLYQKAVGMEIAKYDDSEFYNDFVWAMQKAPEYVLKTVETLRIATSNVVVALLAGGYIITTDSVALLVVAVMLGSTLLVQGFINKAKVRREEDKLPVSRKRDYINRVFYLIDFVKDIKTGAVAPKLEKEFTDTSEEMKKLVDKHGHKIAWLAVVRDSVEYVVYEGAYLTYLFYQALVKGKYGLGELMGVYRAANQFSGRLRRVIMFLPNFQEYSLYVQKMRTFLETENQMQDIGTTPAPKTGDICLRDVYFTYPGNTNATLKGVSLNVKQGERIALVGYNGAGKSTLVKLLLRLYDPTQGEILFGGNRIQSYPIEQYRARFGALFQDFEIIAATLGQNLTMSDAPLDTHRADTVLRQSAFWERFENLPAGYDTQLTKEFDKEGTGLSGGEAQKIALARVLYADAGVIILDEPSSALDPIAEYELNKTVTQLAGEKTVIIISHRLSTTRFVDKIYMLEDGRVVEQGNHNTLLAQKGKYAEMFARQAEKYQ